MRASSGEAIPMSRQVEVWPFWVSSVWLLSRLMQLHGRGGKWPSITIRLEMAFECRHRRLAWSNRSTLVTVRCVVHLFAARVWRCIFRIKNQKVAVANSALRAPSVCSQTGHASLYLDMQIFKMRRTSVNIIGCCVDDLMVVAV